MSKAVTKYRCPNCRKWVSETEWDADEGLCTKCLIEVDKEEIEKD